MFKEDNIFASKPFNVNTVEPEVDQPVWFLSEDMVPRFGYKDKSGRFVSGFSKFVAYYWWPSTGISLKTMFPNMNKY